MNKLHSYHDEGSTVYTRTPSGRQLVATTDVNGEGKIEVYVKNIPPYREGEEWLVAHVAPTYSAARTYMERAS